MRKFGSLALAAAGALVLVACSETPTGAPAVEEVDVQLDAKPNGNGGGGGGGGEGGGGETSGGVDFLFPEVGYGVVGDGSDDVTIDGVLYNRYVHGKCGVDAAIQSSGDATLNTLRKGKCPFPAPRTLRIDFDETAEGEDVEVVTVFINVKDIASVTSEEQRPMNLNPWSTSRCENIHFRENLLDGTATEGGQSVTVTRVDANTWRVWNDESSDSAACAKGDGTFEAVTLPLSFYVITR